MKYLKYRGAIKIVDPWYIYKSRRGRWYMSSRITDTLKTKIPSERLARKKPIHILQFINECENIDIKLELKKELKTEAMLEDI